MPLIYPYDTSTPYDSDKRNEQLLQSAIQGSFNGPSSMGTWIRPPVSSVILKTDNNLACAVNGNQGDVSYMLVGDTMGLQINLPSVTVPNCNQLYVRIPDGYVLANRSGGPQNRSLDFGLMMNGGAIKNGYLQVLPSFPQWVIATMTGATIAADTTFGVWGSLFFECLKGN
jgi:hypothetical protein